MLELFRLTAHELCDMIRDKKASSVEITKSLLDRICAVDNKIESYLNVCKELALKRACEVQERIDKGDIKSPLAGIPFAIKDNICTEGIVTTCASKMLEDFNPPYSATVVKNLYSCDAVLLGKLNMDEFAMGGSTETSYYKKTKNPWNIEKVPGGSSGGSAASVCTDQAVFSLGSDTGGSIRQPASFCGVVGMKPTYGAVSRYGLIAFASSLDQIGPITKDVTDCALVLNAICGHDSLDSTSANIEYPDYTKALKDNIKGVKIGVPKEYLEEGLNNEVKEQITSALDVLSKLGAEWEEFSFPITEYAVPAYYIISSAEASSNLARYDGIKYGYRAQEYSNLMELYKNTRSKGFGAEVKRRIMLGTYALSSGYYDAYYKKALKVRTIIKEGFNKAFEKYDVILGPTAPTTAYGIGEKINNPLEMYMGDIYTVSVNIAGLPGIVVPCGFDSSHLPVGLQLIGKAFDESTLLRVAYTYEQNTDFNKAKPEV